MYRLRELERDDLLVINTWRRDEELIDYLGAAFRYINVEVENKWFDDYMLNREKNIRCSILNEEDDVVGLVSLTQINRLNQSAVAHIMIGENKNRERGIGYYAVNQILKHAFYDMNFNRVELTVLESNQRSINVAKKVGFKQEGNKRQAAFKKGKFVNTIIMAILKEDYIEHVALT